MNTSKRDAIRRASAASVIDPQEYARARDRERLRDAIEVLASVDTGRLAEVVAQFKKSKAKSVAVMYATGVAVLDAIVDLHRTPTGENEVQ